MTPPSTTDCGSSALHKSCRLAPKGEAGTPALSSSLEPLETSPPPSPAHIDHTRLGKVTAYTPRTVTEEESHFRHSGWAVRRRKVYHALMSTGQSENRIAAFANCGSALFVAVDHGSGNARLTCNACHDRFCVVCGRTKARVISAATTALIKAHSTRFLTLTLRASDTPLVDQLGRITRDFTVLRRRAWWKEHVDGGAAFLEVKVGENSGRWHVHLHVLVAGTYLPQAELSREWYAVTGDSFIVDVRECTDPAGRSRYVTKYVTKPASAEVFEDAARLEEFVKAIKGKRLCNTFGSWRGTCLDPSAPAEGEWESVGELSVVMRRAAGGDGASLRLLLLLRDKYPGLVDLIDRFDSATHPRPPA